MDVQMQNPTYTILRIKRKRTEGPLDALVVESRSRRKKSRGGVDVFQFAQTVEQDAWENNALKQHLQSQISKLAQDDAPRVQGQQDREMFEPPQTNNGTRRYAVRVTGGGEDPSSKRRPMGPPKVISSKDIPRNDFKMYDAVLEDQGPLMDPEMENFLPMLQDYLTLQDKTIGMVTPGSSSHAIPNEDFVWDVFYRRPYSLSEWNSLAANFGTVTGIPPSAEDEEWSDDSESEEEDEADEDSNAEEYYKNDYPDEADSDSDDDFFHDASEGEDFSSNPADSDHDWR